MSKRSSRIYGFWDRLDKEIKEKNITKSELSRRVGCSKKTLYRTSMEEATPNGLYLAKICVQLNVSADYLLGLKSDKVLNKSI